MASNGSTDQDARAKGPPTHCFYLPIRGGRCGMGSNSVNWIASVALDFTKIFYGWFALLGWFYFLISKTRLHGCLREKKMAQFGDNCGEKMAFVFDRLCTSNKKWTFYDIVLLPPQR